MKKMTALILFVSAELVWSCSKDKASNQTNDNNCNTANMSYANDIQPIISGNCTGSCHNANNPTGNRILTTYSGVVDAIDNGKLVGVISHSAGYPPMPQGGAKLSDCSINKIKAWIEQGALNN